MDARLRLLVLTIGLCLMGVAAARAIAQDAKSAEPSLRYVEAERAVVYAGPSEEYYPTSVLKRGDAVEVYQQTEDGWLAIRPPKGSFSWLPATQGFLLPGGRVVEVTEAEAVSWIGSSLGTAKQYRWQVRLSRGEQLNVIGEQTLSDDQSDKKQLWYKINPPNGEFRWVPAQAVGAESDQAASGVATANDARPGAAGEVSTAGGTRQRGSQSILQASAEEPSAAAYANEPQTVGSMQAQPRGLRANGQPGGDRWSTWHAIEYRNGNFSFPGIARMMGMEPAPISNDHDSYDPFDVATAATMGRPVSGGEDTGQEPAAPQAIAAGSESNNTAPNNAVPNETTALGLRKNRGWRDPRQLREMREHGSLDRQASEGTYADASYAAAQPAVGSGVITAAANAGASSSAGSANDAQWYGIVQAPQASNYQPLQLQHAGLSEIQALLSEMVAGPEHTWNLAPLADRTRYLIEHGVTAIERGEARLLLDRIEAFADLARRATELGMTPPVALPASVNASLSASPIAAAATRWASPLGLSSTVTEVPSGSAPRFDATGWVVPVHSSNPDMPTHALTNDTGRIIVYLSPAAGVNLARYQAQAIGVYGLRGYLPQLKANHIQVQRAVRLH